MKTFNNLDELIAQAKKDNACKEGIEFLNTSKSLQEVFDNVNFQYCLWALKRDYVQFEDYFDWEEIDSFFWVELLKFKPQYADKCDKWNEFTPTNWINLLKFQPQLIEKFKQKKTNENI